MTIGQTIRFAIGSLLYAVAARLFYDAAARLASHPDAIVTTHLPQTPMQVAAAEAARAARSN